MISLILSAALTLSAQAQASCEARAELAWDQAAMHGDQYPDAAWEDELSSCDSEPSR